MARADSPFDSRIMGGYAVIPTVHTLRAARRDSERLDLVVDTLAFVEQYRDSLLGLMDDSMIGLRERGVTWRRLGQRTGLPEWKARERVQERIARRRVGHADPDRVLSADTTKKRLRRVA